MQYIQHRINSIDGLKNLDSSFGAEVDVRYHENELVLHHDPFGHHMEPAPQRLEAFLEKYKLQGPLILNIKTEGIEERCIALMLKYKITNWFFLDLSMPFFANYAQRAFETPTSAFSSKNLAVRYSEREPIEYALSFVKKAAWVWVDCFTKLPLDKKSYELLKKEFKICLVSPELQGHNLNEIGNFKTLIKDFDIDAVCTKRPDLWK